MTLRKVGNIEWRSVLRWGELEATWSSTSQECWRRSRSTLAAYCSAPSRAMTCTKGSRSSLRWRVAASRDLHNNDSSGESATSTATSALEPAELWIDAVVFVGVACAASFPLVAPAVACERARPWASSVGSLCPCLPFKGFFESCPKVSDILGGKTGGIHHSTETNGSD